MRRIGFIIGVSAVLALNACTEPGETTEVGAATGGVIGAGLGAIVGSQTGDAGSGLVIGALAGAGTGAAVGNALQAQNEAIRSQDEAIERQDQNLRAQRSEIDELRRMSQDNVRFRAAPGARPGYPPAPLRAPAPPLNQPNRIAVTERPLPPGLQPRGFSSSVPAADRGPEAVEPNVIARVPSAEPARPPIDLARPSVDQSKPHVETDGHEAAASLVSTQQQPPATEPAATAECKQGQQEYAQAQSLSDAPERLFHIRRALRLCPDVPDYHVGLGDVYLSLGRRDDAKFEYSEAQRLNPSSAEVRAKLQDLTKDTY